MKVAVVGGGIVGLTTALQLKQELRNAEITVYAASFDDTTSHVAAGVFRIGNSYSGPTEEITREWIDDSWQYYDEIRKSRDSAEAGVASLSCYMFANSGPKAVKSYWLEKLLPVYRTLGKEEFYLVGGDWKYGAYFSTIVTQCAYHLPWATRKLRENGVTLIERKLDALEELMYDHNLIFNCSGLGARDLCDDRRVVPIRGQVIKVEAPWLKTGFYGELDTYVIPGIDGTVTVGGTRGFDSSSLEICPHETAAIRERCNKLVPSLGKAKVLGYATGLRPFRENNVVHNYGHGGYGVCTAPGTSKYAISLAKMEHKSSGWK